MTQSAVVFAKEIPSSTEAGSSPSLTSSSPSETSRASSAFSAHDRRKDLSLSPEERFPGCSESGRRMLVALYAMSAAEVFEIAVDAGIYTPDGQLTANYRDDAEPSACRPTD
jgi:hypothetical protein